MAGRARQTALTGMISTEGVRILTGRVFASLFYLRLQRPPAVNNPPPFILELEVACRLSMGEHLNAVAHALLDRQIQLYWSLSGREVHICMCDRPTWKDMTSSGRPLSWQLQMEALSLDSQVKVQMDSICAAGDAEDIGNSSCTVTDLIAKAHEASWKDEDHDGRPGVAASDADEETALSPFENRVSSFGGPNDLNNQLEALGRCEIELKDKDHDGQSVITGYDFDGETAPSLCGARLSSLDYKLDKLGNELEEMLHEWK